MLKGTQIKGMHFSIIKIEVFRSEIDNFYYASAPIRFHISHIIFNRKKI